MPSPSTSEYAKVAVSGPVSRFSMDAPPGFQAHGKVIGHDGTQTGIDRHGTFYVESPT
jgi:hypothetical protein